MTQFLIGFDRIDITPKVPLPLYGMGNDYVRKENFVSPKCEADKLLANTVVFSNGNSESTVVLCVLDTLFIHEFFSVPVAKAIGEILEVPSENVVLTATHTHSGVSMIKPDEDVKCYNEWLKDELVKSAKRASDDLTKASALGGNTDTNGMNFQRRFILKDGSHRCTIADGKFNTDDIASYETETDRTLRAVRFIREGKKDVVIANWQAHPGFTPSFTIGRVSADFIGDFRLFGEEDGSANFVYIQGAAGNLEARTRFKSDPYYEWNRTLDRVGYAKELVRILNEDIAFSEIEVGDIKIQNAKLEVRQKVGKDILDEKHVLPLTAITFGDIAICTAPNELYSDSGLELRRRSPFKATLLCTNANGCYGYLPIKACFDGESYNTNEKGDSFGVRVSKCEAGTAEKVTETLAKMLER